MLPIYIFDGKTVLPETGTFYVIAKGGIYLHKDTGLINALVKIDGISPLEEIKVHAKFKLPHLPSELIVQALLFFRSVYQKHRAEAMVLLYFSESKQQFSIDAPSQEVSHSGIKYIPNTDYIKDNVKLVGTIHSHADFSAFHSGTDVHDEKDFDGIHITIGNVDKPYFSISSTTAVNSNRFVQESEELIDGLYKVDYHPPPKKVKNYCYKRTLGIDRDYLSKGAFTNYFDKPIYENIWAQDSCQFYDLKLPEGKDYRSCPFPKAWSERVRSLKFTFIKNSIQSLFSGNDDIPEKDDKGIDAYYKTEKKIESKSHRKDEVKI